MIDSDNQIDQEEERINGEQTEAESIESIIDKYVVVFSKIHPNYEKLPSAFRSALDKELQRDFQKTLRSYYQNENIDARNQRHIDKMAQKQVKMQTHFQLLDAKIDFKLLRKSLRSDYSGRLKTIRQEEKQDKREANKVKFQRVKLFFKMLLPKRKKRETELPKAIPTKHTKTISNLSQPKAKFNLIE